MAKYTVRSIFLESNRVDHLTLNHYQKLLDIQGYAVESILFFEGLAFKQDSNINAIKLIGLNPLKMVLGQFFSF